MYVCYVVFDLQQAVSSIGVMQQAAFGSLHNFQVFACH
jgi:hypothetical protein